MALNVLIVEDQIEQLDYLELVTRRFWNDRESSLKLNTLRIDRAAVAVEARRLLARAAERGEVYDLVLLDLGLPENPGEKEQTELGLQLIEIAVNTRVANRILVISAFPEFNYVVPAFQRGANDFIKKPFDKHELFHRLDLLLTGLLNEARGQVLEKRRQELAPYVWKYVAHRFSACFSRFIQTVGNDADVLSDEISERFGLSRLGTSQDAIVGALRGLTEATLAADAEWARLQEAFDRDPGVQPETVTTELCLESWLADFARESRLCLNLEFDGNWKPETRVLSLGGNWQTALREILLGGLTSPRRQHWGSRIKVSVQAKGDLAEVCFTDELPALPAEIADKINREQHILPNEGPWRAWGLGIVQHIASLGGGKLSVHSSVDSSARETGNHISLFIPRIRHG